MADAPTIPFKQHGTTMSLRLPTRLAVTALVVSTACATGAPDAGTGGGWVGTITTAGDATTVVNESGSVWGGEPLFPPETGWESPCLTYMENGREDQYCNIPFQPRAVGELTAEGAWAVGTTDNYAFQVHKPDGSILRVQRYWTPVAVSAAEADYHKRQTTAYIREDDPSWSWNGPEIPDHKPAYLQLLPARDGRLWVLREGPSRESTDCLDEEPECWVPEGYWLDAFGPDGRFLGSVTLDRRPSYRPFIADTTIVAIVTDGAGTIMVKRYRLLLPA
jgi:hypothetical protein